MVRFSRQSISHPSVPCLEEVLLAVENVPHRLCNREFILRFVLAAPRIRRNRLIRRRRWYDRSESQQSNGAGEYIAVLLQQNSLIIQRLLHHSIRA